MVAVTVEHANNIFFNGIIIMLLLKTRLRLGLFFVALHSSILGHFSIKLAFGDVACLGEMKKSFLVQEIRTQRRVYCCVSLVILIIK